MEKILVEVSARHIHLSQADLDTLFGEGYQLTCKKELSQPGQFACAEKVTVKGPKGEMKMSILGPVRKHTQVEVSLTDARALGVVAQIRESGDTDGTSGVTVIGPNGSIDIPDGVIAAKRHIHMTEEDAKNYKQAKEQINELKNSINELNLHIKDLDIEHQKEIYELEKSHHTALKNREETIESKYQQEITDLRAEINQLRTMLYEKKD